MSDTGATVALTSAVSVQPGDIIQMKKGVLFINGQAVKKGELLALVGEGAM